MKTIRMTELTLAEQFLLTIHHTDKPRYAVQGNQIVLGMLGAMLLDLIEANDIKIEADKIKVIPKVGSSSKHPDLYKILEASSKPRKVSQWIQRLTYKGNKLKYTLLQNLSRKRFITLERKKFLGLIPYNITEIINKSRHRADVSHIKSLLLLNKEASKSEQLLLSILIGSRIIPYLGKDREERKNLRKKAKDYKQPSSISSEVDKAVQQMQAAIATSIAVTSATTVNH